MVQLDSVNGPAAPSEITAAPIDPRRYRKLRFFLLRVLVHALWNDLVLNRPLLAWARRDPVPRWQEIARRYRSLAVEMGGVLIKLGQFLSIRVDLLPAEILHELAGLQDEVPPHPVQEIEAQIAAEYGRPVDQVFAGFSPVATGAASLAQVHHARLPSGQEVVVKVLRPGIEVLVETDLKAVDLALKYLKLSRMIRRRVDLDRLAEEFRRTTLRELDMMAEAASAERFDELFADDEKVRVPRVYPAASTRRVLVLEDVGFIKLADRAGLLAVGIDPAEVARTLYRIYMRQLFEHNFVHADPHPGNLFVEPLPTEAEREAGVVAFRPGERPPHAAGRPFRVVFIDFGMTAVIPPRLRGALREYLIGLGTRDAARMVHSYQMAGVLLPGADLRRIEEAHRDMFDRFWGVPLGELRRVAMTQMGSLLAQYRDLIYEVPFQMPVDLLFVNRAVGILAGLATSLDHDFDPWAETIPYAERIAAQEAGGLFGAAEEGLRQLMVLATLPGQLDRFLTRAERGGLVVQTGFTPEAKSSLDRLERMAKRLSWVLVAVGLLLAGTLLRAEGGWLDDAFLAGSLLSLLWGLGRYR